MHSSERGSSYGYGTSPDIFGEMLAITMEAGNVMTNLARVGDALVPMIFSIGPQILGGRSFSGIEAPSYSPREVVI